MPSKRNTDVPNLPSISLFLSSNSQKNAYAATATVHLINTRVVGISRGDKGKTPWFRTNVSISLSQAAKYDRSRYKQTINQILIVTFLFCSIASRGASWKTPIWIVRPQSYVIANRNSLTSVQSFRLETPRKVSRRASTCNLEPIYVPCFRRASVYHRHKQINCYCLTTRVILLYLSRPSPHNDRKL